MAIKTMKDDSPGAVFNDLVGTLVGKHGQLDIRLQRVAVTMPGTPLGFEVNGTVTVSLHLRELSDEERRAHVAANVAALKA
jgi:hypothetical protein